MLEPEHAWICGLLAGQLAGTGRFAYVLPEQDAAGDYTNQLTLGLELPNELIRDVKIIILPLES